MTKDEALLKRAVNILVQIPANAPNCLGLNAYDLAGEIVAALAAPASKPEGILSTGEILALERRSNMTNDEALRYARSVETALLRRCADVPAKALTDGRIFEIANDFYDSDGPGFNMMGFARAIEAELKRGA